MMCAPVSSYGDRNRCSPSGALLFNALERGGLKKASGAFTRFANLILFEGNWLRHRIGQGAVETAVFLPVFFELPA